MKNSWFLSAWNGVGLLLVQFRRRRRRPCVRNSFSRGLRLARRVLALLPTPLPACNEIGAGGWAANASDHDARRVGRREGSMNHSQYLDHTTVAASSTAPHADDLYEYFRDVLKLSASRDSERRWRPTLHHAYAHTPPSDNVPSLNEIGPISIFTQFNSLVIPWSMDFCNKKLTYLLLFGW